ncbi:MAG: MFS transporter, partial [Acidimicrobiia bacterium]|nr:MFS transporter [Acidimicrobiia bacterium]
MAADRKRWLGLAVLSLGVAIIIMDATIVNVAIPSIIRDLDIQLVDAEWITTIYSLVFAALLITLGRIGDQFGRKHIFHGGLVLFMLASLLAGRAPSGPALVGARSLQGVGAAMILPSTLSIVNATFRGRDRAIAFGVWGSVIGGMAAIGPLVGGWLTTDYSWRWAFYINIPIGIAVIAGSLLWVLDSRDENVQRGFDPAGIAAISLGLLGLIFSLIEGSRYGWWTPTNPFAIGSWNWPFESVSPVVPALAVAVIGITVFVLTERRRSAAGKPVLFKLELFRLTSFRNGNITAAILSLGELGLIFILPLFLQAVLGYTALRTGVLFAALAAGAFVGGPSAAALAHRFGPRWVVTTGMGIEAFSIGLIALTISPDVGGWTLAPVLFLYGIGVGLATAQLTSVILGDVPPGDSGQASGMQSTFRQVGSALGIALIGTLLAVNLSTFTEEELADVAFLPDVARSGLASAVSASAGQLLPALRQGDLPQIGEMPAMQLDAQTLAPIVEGIEKAFADAAARSAMMAALFVTFGFALSFRIPNPDFD